MANEITDAALSELRRLHEAATPGPWESQYADKGSFPREIARQFTGSMICVVGPRQQVRSHSDGGAFPSADASLIAAARNALPGLLARLERAERERDEARHALAAYEHHVNTGRSEQHERLLARIATLEAALRQSTRELKAWRGAVDDSWGGVALRLTDEAIGVAESALPGVEGK